MSETKKVADALEMKVAFGEQDTSLWLFQWLIENKVMDVVQPDLNYNGGFIRAARKESWFSPNFEIKYKEYKGDRRI